MARAVLWAEHVSKESYPDEIKEKERERGIEVKSK
jgi:hypothetical protein